MQYYFKWITHWKRNNKSNPFAIKHKYNLKLHCIFEFSLPRVLLELQSVVIKLDCVSEFSEATVFFFFWTWLVARSRWKEL